jgi:hypothetical protein
VAFVGIYVWLMRCSTLVAESNPRLHPLTVAVLAGLVFAFGSVWLGEFIFAAVAAAFALPTWPAACAVAAITAFAFAVGLVSGASYSDVGQVGGLSAASALA